MMNYRHLLVCLFLGFTSVKGYGQETHALSLSQLWEQAFAHYPSLEAYRARLNGARLHQKLVRNQALPQLLLQVQNTIGTQNAVGGAFFPLPGLYNVGGSGTGNAAAPAANLFGSLVMDWQFLQFGRQKKSVEAAGILTEQASHRLSAEQLAIQAELSRTYLQLLFHRQMEQWAAENTERLQQMFDAAKSTARAGLSPGADSLLIKASLRQTAAVQDDWQGRSEESTIALATWANSSPEQLNFRHTSFPAVAAIQQEKPALNTNHPQLAYRQEQVAYAGKLKEVAASAALPSLSLLGGVQFRGHAPAQEGALSEGWADAYNKPAGNYLLGLGLRWNLGGLIDYKPEQARYQEAIHQRQAEADEVALKLRSRQQIAQRQLAHNLRQINHAEDAYQAASEAYRQFEARYKSGLISISELLQVQDVLQKTEKTRLEAYFQYWMQQADLAEARADFSILHNAFE